MLNPQRGGSSEQPLTRKSLGIDKKAYVYIFSSASSSSTCAPQSLTGPRLSQVRVLLFRVAAAYGDVPKWHAARGVLHHIFFATRNAKSLVACCGCVLSDFPALVFHTRKVYKRCASHFSNGPRRSSSGTNPQGERAFCKDFGS